MTDPDPAGALASSPLQQEKEDRAPRVEPFRPCVETAGSTAEQSRGAVTAATRGLPPPDFWRCRTCGCLWRDNHPYDDDSVSLGSAKQTSCGECEMKPTAEACEPLFRAEALGRLQSDSDILRRSNIIEIAVANDTGSVSEYMDHWEGRALKAEAETETLRAELARLQRERDEGREIVAKVNNEVLGSYGYFTEPSCVEAVGNLKLDANRQYQELEKLRADVARLRHLAHQLEICICAAIKMGGLIIRGHRHDDCLRNIKARRLDSEPIVQGFMTSQNRFVDREEAMQLQRAAGEKSAYSPDGELHGDILFSEDLY